jgi:hypothetical protein
MVIHQHRHYLQAKAMKRRYKPLETESDDFGKDLSALPTDRPVGVYYRQSTQPQVGNVSTSMQMIDLPKLLKERGWPEDKVILIDMDAGVSGQLRIDERDGMRHLFDLITSGSIGTVACTDEDRLFRDVTQIQVNVFIEACRQSRVFVFTPSMLYNFAHPQMGDFYIRQFRFKCEMAAEYIKSYIKGRLHPAKNRLLMDGRWAGSTIPMGFMVDMRKTLPDGSVNPTWRKLSEFSPYSNIVNEYFRLFLKYGGQLRTTLRHIQLRGPWYPELSQHKPPTGFKVTYRMHRYGNGYCPGRQGLEILLTNVAYIGHWTFKDKIVKLNNHAAIVPEDVFMRAYNYLSDVGFDGKPNPNYTPVTDYARPSSDDERGVERPLLSGLIVSKDGDEQRNVGTDWVRPEQHYAYTLRTPDPIREYAWSKTASYVDGAVVGLLRQKLEATFDTSVWNANLTATLNNLQADKKRRGVQISTLEKVMEGLIASLESLTLPEVIQAVEKKYKDAKAEHDRLLMEQANNENEVRQLDTINKLKDACGPAIENWDNLSRDEKRTILRAFIDQIEATPIEDHGLYLQINWRDHSNDQIRLHRQATHGNYWSPDELAQLLKLATTNAEQQVIAASFPERTWLVIRNRIVWSLGSGIYAPGERPIHEYETFHDYMKRINNASTYPVRATSRWSADDIERLEQLVYQGATQTRIASVFPDRSWRAITLRMKRSFGPHGYHVELEGINTIETYNQYLKRVGQDTFVHMDSVTRPGIAHHDEPTWLRPAWARCRRRSTRRG